MTLSATSLASENPLCEACTALSHKHFTNNPWPMGIFERQLIA